MCSGPANERSADMRLRFGHLVAIAALSCSLLGGLAEAQTTFRPDWKERFRAHDANGDGRIDRAEFQGWMAEVFFQRDQGRKGYLTVDDVRGSMTPEVFKAMNQKGDGKLGLPEFLNALFQDFQAIDTGGQGSITPEEIEAYIRKPVR
jgi:Ca2+-binding EF-hand superfamily protein